ncbi:MAG TPA: glutamate-1-semialdehyde 2,1-aminomutase [Candidatus Avoscillospira stercoripullorum]|uniref:Glutamate-1-semialdehyde 2,1-aminomutase n=1 Tax=Candidatus Avoscillospira stercoripullorum TaxID=2840709 RepID=A0A9D1A6U2_9FIRM|nr:glutamate-1-semialdehyde 2,1-aminomutase [Candidatus Avoscillospira stercoripullorum]
MTRSETLFQAAQLVMPGGVNSPVRACRAVGTYPRFLSEGRGSHVIDVDGNEYIDLICSWGPLILGHCHQAVEEAVLEAVRHGLSFGAPTEIEVKMAELVTKMTGTEMVRMVNSGTEAVMSALRLARGATGRSKIIKFAGCYHGHSDSMLVKAGSGALTGGAPDSAGVPAEMAADTLTAKYNDAASVRSLLEANPGQVAAVIVEPVAANMGVVPPQPGFLEALRGLCDAYGALLIFDEVITGFRLSAGGAQRHYGVHADLVTYGKIIGGGMPVGAYAGSRKLMEQVSPLGAVYQAGTLSGNPVAMAAGLAQLEILENNPDIYTALERKGKRLQEGLQEIFRKAKVPAQVNRAGSILTVFFSKTPVTGYDQARACDLERFAKWYRGLLEHGIYAAPSQFEAMFLSAAHQEEDIDAILVAAEEVAKTL